MDAKLSHLKYRKDIDGLRAIAVLAVVAFHAAPGRMPSGFIGVDIFFVISGFLISTIIFKGLESNSFSFIDFYIRRVRRIFPALLIVLLTSLIFGYFTLPDGDFKSLGKHIAGGASFVSNFVLWSESGYFDNAAHYKPLLHLWSLGIEEQFYIIWPFFLWLAWKRKFGYLRLILFILITSFVLNIYTIEKYPVATFYSPFTRFWELSIGSVLAYVCMFTSYADLNKNNQICCNLVSALGGLLLLTAFVTISSSRNFPGWWALLPTFGTLFLIWAGPNSWINRVVLSNSLLVWFGLISYPLYLWHWILLSFCRVIEGNEVAQTTRLVAVTLSIIFAWLTFKFVENPIRQRSKEKVTPYVLVTLLGLLGLVGYYGFVGSESEGRSGSPRVANAGEIGHFPFFSKISVQYFPCTPLDILKNADNWNGFGRCFQSKENSVIDVAIIGDSHAEHLFPGLASRLTEKNIVYYGKGALPFLSNKNFNQIFQAVLDDENIKVVLLAANWNENFKTYTAKKWQYDLTETVTKLVAADKLVYLIGDVPTFSFLPHRCKYEGRLGIENKCSELDQQAGSTYLPVFELIAANINNVKVIDIYDQLCHQGLCSMASAGILFYRDENHLNISGSKMIANIIANRMSH